MNIKGYGYSQFIMEAGELLEGIIGSVLLLAFGLFIIYRKLYRPHIKVGYNTKESIIGTIGWVLLIPLSYLFSKILFVLIGDSWDESPPMGLFLTVFVVLCFLQIVGMKWMKRRRLNSEPGTNFDEWRE